jgi:hypothetical protein
MNGMTGVAAAVEVPIRCGAMIDWVAVGGVGSDAERSVRLQTTSSESGQIASPWAIAARRETRSDISVPVAGRPRRASIRSPHRHRDSKMAARR